MPSENPAEPIPKAALKRSKLMNDPEVRLERLGPQHALDEFECGHADLDTWLKRHALAAQQMGSARTFVLVEGEHVMGYFSLTMGSVLRAEAPGKLVRGLPSYPVGMVLLARLAVHRGSQGRGLGGWLLAEALRKAVSAGEAAAARLVVVDVIDEDAARFYARHAFIAVPEHPSRLYRRMKDIRMSLEAPDAS
jgi:GNAT superfamily N-acetyltransferase